MQIGGRSFNGKETQVTYLIKLHHLGHSFEILMDAPSRGEIIRRIQALKEPIEIISIKDFILDPSHPG